MLLLLRPQPVITLLPNHTKFVAECSYLHFWPSHSNAMFSKDWEKFFSISPFLDLNYVKSDSKFCWWKLVFLARKTILRSVDWKKIVNHCPNVWYFLWSYSDKSIYSLFFISSCDKNKMPIWSQIFVNFDALLLLLSIFDTVYLNSQGVSLTSSSYVNLLFKK